MSSIGVCNSKALLKTTSLFTYSTSVPFTFSDSQSQSQYGLGWNWTWTNDSILPSSNFNKVIGHNEIKTRILSFNFVFWQISINMPDAEIFI
jgi:hypothetical protein